MVLRWSPMSGRFFNLSLSDQLSVKEPWEIPQRSEDMPRKFLTDRKDHHGRWEEDDRRKDSSVATILYSVLYPTIREDSSVTIEWYTSDGMAYPSD